ncbi:Xaa-Pro dipeptidase [Exilibacterium tricleocarpae]|uniref:Xaa-Pro dipeptidase n=1 Tax=Exilibacterium tricleocarpae TaxID=2591008 RepID=A0A545TNI6_9GAMM|nr:Xaa-Pro dipeptidase [Exilibacterium tricleocarpae]TQV78748.1 Xaa-Pro dipeptidase [Exilibacterium tricleocarpae]
MTDLYAKHIDNKMAVYREVFDITPWRKVIIHAGSEHVQFRDDVHYPFKANPYFKEWLPLADYPDAYLVIEADQSLPRLLVKQVEDFWHSPAQPPAAAIVEAFDIAHYSSGAQLQAGLGIDAATVVIAEGGDDIARQLQRPEQHNNTEVLHIVDYHRACKSDYEIDCMSEANRIAVRGHRAAAAAFHEGGSEYAIHQAYLAATEHTENELPYGNICALNEHAAVLHHMHLNKTPPAERRSFLIDAGATCAGYAADITRSYQTDGPLQDPDFAALLAGIDAYQQQLVQRCRVGMDYLDLHLSMHTLLTRLLCEMGVFKLEPEAALARGLSRAFCPHGLGHLIGIQVHDRGGHQCDRQGQLRPPPQEHSFLRCTRTLAEGMVVTVEPGAYFIPSLLQPLRQSQPQAIDWSLVDKLAPFGGVRIEDDVLVTAAAPRNFTREAFAALVD